MGTRSLRAVALALSVASPLLATPSSLVFIDPGEGPALAVNPAFVNNRGDVSFHFTPSPFRGLTQSYIRWADGTLEEVSIDLPDGAQGIGNAYVWGIDDSGVALVVRDSRVDGDERRGVYRYERGGAATLAGDFDRVSLSNAAIGRHGHIAVLRAEVAGVDSAGLVLLDPGDAQTVVGRPAGQTPIVFGINAHGEGAGTVQGAGVGYRATRFGADGGVVTLDQFDRSFANDINDAGTVAGWRSPEPFGGSDDNADVFLWRDGASDVEFLARPEGAMSAYATAINNLEWVGGVAIYEGPQGLPFTREQAILWMPGSDPLNLNEYFAAHLNGATLMSVEDISDTGWIVGIARDAMGFEQLFLAQIPAPASSLALGGLALLGVRRRR